MIQSKKDLLASANETFVLFNEESWVRRERHNDERFYSVVDIVGILTESPDARNYWKVLKHRLKAEWSEVVTNCNQLKFLASDWKKYSWDGANTEWVLRIIQSIPSPNAEPLKRWIASLGNERFQEMNDPELGMVRARERAIVAWKAKGWSDEQIKLRLQSIDTRNNYTDELKERRIEKKEYGILTNIGYGWTGMKAKDLKEFKGLGKGHNIRDNMTNHELLLTQLQEETAKEIIVQKDASGFNEIAICVQKSAEVTKVAKDSIEEATGKPVITDRNKLTEQQKRNALRKKQN